MGGHSYHGGSENTEKLLKQVPPSRGSSAGPQGPFVSPTVNAPFANNLNDFGVKYTWTPPVSCQKPKALPAIYRPPQPGPPGAGIGPDPRRAKGVGKGFFSDNAGIKPWPYVRDNVGIDRTESETTKHWDTQCGKINKLPVPTSSMYRSNVEHAMSKQKCDIRQDAQTFAPNPKGLERIYPRDVSQWPERNPKPMIRLNTPLSQHTDKLQTEGLITPGFGQTLTSFGGAMKTAKPDNQPPATMLNLSRGELRGQWWVRERH
mmetsp:Transcript_26035/g.49462  ORF Transcript_26035/g.49462 Transcript_26035/m.49462 type:complete len:261 (+) Transcript_26035:325-1107(+)|eukprot:CAMPEP_0114233460 /NCGR_PEP_ID=MMETSP0058-20121206/5179_1 /TAXON_ID=36894 /ORGANISM="Pyramimonas parkeae, CCMP726" /LENGTH=260 /DNA_ID=CAMNT_0001345057 /DNA_START=629 /DNA_END=1411 /DNA_ORIENTATION=-